MAGLSGKVAIVTGASGGMGQSHCEALARAGAKVVLTDTHEKEGSELADRLGNDTFFIRHDVTCEDDWSKVVGATISKFGLVNVLVNNAGIASAQSIEDCSIAAYRKIIEVNQFGPFLGMRAVIPLMRACGGGSIINISSTAGFVGTAGQIGYCDSKFALRGMTKVAAIELGAFHIRVNTIHPGITATPQLLNNPDRERFMRLAKKLPLGRIAEPAEISNLVLFLASDESSFSTGAEFIVDGGMTAM